MKTRMLIAFILFIAVCSKSTARTNTSDKPLLKDSIPAIFLGDFVDDYDIHYSVSDSLWIQYPGTKYHILKWDAGNQYIIARNDNKNPADGGLYTRIDYMSFDNINPYLWGYCFTVYNAKSDHEAEAAASADRQNPKKGCGGFPFSRMKKKEN